MTSNAQQLVRAAMQVHQSGDFEKAKVMYLDILEQWPRHPDALHLYGLACHQTADHLTAVKFITLAVQQVPDQAVLRNNLGDALHRAGQLDEAVLQLEKALELRPGYAGAHQNLGSTYLTARHHDLALFHCQQAVDLDGKTPEAWFNLGLCLLDHVHLQECADAFRQALHLRPTYQTAVTSLLYVLNLLPDLDPQTVAEEHRRVAKMAFATSMDKVVDEVVGERKDRPTNQPVRIGYVSGDFRQHAVSYFFEPVLELHDKDSFETYCYSDVSQPDETTRRLQRSADHWREMAGRSNEKLFEQVLADGIDILVDLAGHTRDNRMPVFAGRAAPVQISWLGFPNTSGLEAMNYRIVDSVTEPADQANPGTEQLIRMRPGFACFRPPAHAPKVAESPLLRNGQVTLGSLHKLEKLNTEVIALWSTVLRKNPDARLLIGRDNLDDWQQQRLLTAFKQHGVDADRLQLRELNEPGQSFFELFAEIDVFLDVFPWSGHTMACCALWMGVPVVSLRGSSHAGRMVASVLGELELDELVASNRQEYADIIGRLCANQQRLLDYRSGMRARFETSALRDETGFTRDLETRFRRILNF